MLKNATMEIPLTPTNAFNANKHSVGMDLFGQVNICCVKKVASNMGIPAETEINSNLFIFF